MAEILGAIASGISIGALAGQVALSIVKLKSIINDIKDAPEDIKILIDEIEDVQLLISDIENDQAHNPYAKLFLESQSAVRCLDHCRRGVERLCRVADTMTTDFQNKKSIKKKLIAASIIWKRDMVKKYKDELASALRLLILSYQIYTSALIQFQPDIITSKVVQLVKDETTRVISGNSLASPTAAVVRSGVTFTSKRLQFHWLRWKSYSLILGQAWDIKILKSQQGWKFSMKMYAVVSPESLVVKYIQRDNMRGLQRLFSLGKASPFTICLGEDPGSSHYSRPLLRIAAEIGNYEISKFLIDQGADPAFNPDSSWSILTAFAANASNHGRNTDDLYNLVNLIGSRSEVNISELSHYRGSVSVFSALLEHMETPLGELPVNLRCSLAIRLAHNPGFNSSKLFLIALNCKPTLPCAINYQEEGITLLHAAAGALGYLSARNTKDTDFPIRIDNIELEISGWKSILKELIGGGADLHITGSLYIGIQATPFLFMLYHLCDCLRIHLRIDLQHAVTSWISVLSDLNIDLMQYGLREKLTWSAIEFPKREVLYDDEIDYYQYRLIDFEYGPSLKDWRIWINEHTDEYVGDFWDMLEKKENIMPGTWID
ncbi:hypothetical protein F5884DRAFT_862155 [Xylogone sp. PMI_703]|nr:hypothetical protein F5884DRAFT_862155 [Xylogone sp. PMI_703]